MEQQVVLPETTVATVQSSEAILEAPYDQIDGQKVLGAATEVPSTQVDCIVASDADGVVASLRSDLAKPGLNSRVRVELLNQTRMVEVNTCK